MTRLVISRATPWASSWLALTLTTAGFAPAHVRADTPSMARDALQGEWTLNADCHKPARLQIHIDQVLPGNAMGGGVARLIGKAQGQVDEGDEGAPIDAVVAGSYDPDTGLLALDASLAPDDPDFCATFKILGRCVHESNDMFGIERRAIEKHRKERETLLHTSVFHIELLRDDAAGGLSGTMRGEASGCAAITLRRSDQGALTALKPVSPEGERAALGRLDGSGATPLARAYWLTRVADRGDPIAQAEAGRLFDQTLGRRPGDLERAVAYYQQAAAQGEARAQRRLGELYAKGEGVPVDAALSDKWTRAAKATVADVGRHCVAPQMLQAYRRLFESLKRDPSMAMLKLFGGALTGMSFDEGTFRIEGVAVDAVTTATGPFTCRVVGHRVGASASSTLPDFSYVGDDEDGRALYHDNRAESAMAEAVGNMAVAWASQIEAAQPFAVQPKGNRQFKVTLVQQGMSTGYEHATLVALDDPVPASTRPPAPAAPRSPRAGGADEAAAWAQCKDGNRASLCRDYLQAYPHGPHAGEADGLVGRLMLSGHDDAPRRSNPPTSRAPADELANPDQARPASGRPTSSPYDASSAEQMPFSVNAGFEAWSGTWMFDRYVVGSATVQQRQCEQDTCQVTGTFVFQRSGSRVTASYGGTFSHTAGEHYVLQRLCYADPSSGMRDCRNF